MKPVFHLLIPAVLAAASAAAADNAVLEFATPSHDSLPGVFESLTPDELLWRSPLLEGPAVPFQLGKVLSMTRPAREEPPVEGLRDDYEAVITLTNGDVLRGKLSSIADDKVVLRTTYAGELTLRRTMIRNLIIDSRGMLIYAGPNGMDGWKQTQETWKMKNGALASSGHGVLYRELPLPDRVSLSFDMAWNDNLAARFGIFVSDPSAKDRKTGYELNCSRRYLLMRRTDHNGSEEILGQSIHVPSLGGVDKAHFELRADRRAGHLQLLVDGRPVGDWDDSQVDPSGTGSGISFNSEDMAGGIRLTRIRVSPWDGVAKQREDEFSTKETGKPQMILRNGDVLEGDVLSIDHDIMKVKTSFGEVNLPVSRAASFALKSSGMEEPVLKNGDIRCWFPAGGHVTFRLDSSADGQLRGYSQTFGDAAFRIDAFNRIEFNLYNPDYEDLRGDEAPAPDSSDDSGE